MSAAPESPPSGARAAPGEYLKALGVDVWVLRDRPEVPEAAGVVSEPRAPTPARVPRDAHVSTPADGPGPTGEAPTFRIRGFRLGRALALIDEPLWPHRRFFLDVAQAMNGWRADRREDVHFDWPQLAGGQLLSADAGLEAAGRAFRAFVAAQAEDDARVLAVGARVAELLGSAPELAVLHLDRVVDGADKRDLWRRILSLP